jgi:hypothetical protein
MQFRDFPILAVPLLLLWTTPAWTEGTSPKSVHVGENLPHESLPSIELLEFLADWEDDGRWMGPEYFAEISAADQEENRGKNKGGENGKGKDKPNY